MLIKPAFYDSFCCIADKCTDTCCAKWEIDLDDETVERYGSIGGADGDWLRSKISDAEDGTKVLCREGERCPFLRDDNLCEMILRLGEDSLCHICREHPRFYSGSENITEAGVGLCCEEAVRLWLTSDVGFVTEDDGYAPEADETEMLEEQLDMISTVVNGDGTLGERLGGFIFEDGDGDVTDYGDLRSLFMGLEAMEPSFYSVFSDTVQPSDDERFVKLAAYFIYRYYFDLGAELTARFTACALIMIAAMDGELADKVRLFSKEVEYDTDNVGRICDAVEYAIGIEKLAAAVLKSR